MQTQNSFLIFNDIPTSEMTFVKGGTFKMGSDENDREKPIHDVTLDDYWIAYSLLKVRVQFCSTVNLLLLKHIMI